MLSICSHYRLFPASNPIVQDYALPDYSEPSSDSCHKKGSASSVLKSYLLGCILRGPNAEDTENPQAVPLARARSARSSTSARPLQAEDSVVADLSLPCERKTLRQRKGAKSIHPSFFLNAITESDDSDNTQDSDEDGDNDDENFDPSKAQKRSCKGQNVGAAGVDDTDDDESDTSEQDDDEDDDESTEDGSDTKSDAQFLKMGNERFCIPEVLFAPSQLGRSP